MPQRPLRSCAAPGCAVLVPMGRCATHALALRHTRPNLDVHKWYATVAYSHLRQAVLNEAAYTCAHCGQIHADLQVDHLRKHDGDPALFWDRANLQALCAACHTRKTTRGE